MIPPWRKDKPVFRIYLNEGLHVIAALNGTACGYRYRRISEKLGYYFSGFENPELKVKYER